MYVLHIMFETFQPIWLIVERQDLIPYFGFSGVMPTQLCFQTDEFARIKIHFFLHIAPVVKVKSKMNSENSPT